MPIKNKDTHIRFRCTEELKIRLEDVADSYGISVSRLIRDTLYKAVKYREGQLARGTKDDGGFTGEE